MSFYGVELEGGRQQIIAVNDDLHGGISHVIDPIHAECDCEDFTIRCMKRGEKCHHLHAYDIRLADGKPLDCAPVQHPNVPGEITELTREPFYDDEPMEVKAARRERYLKGREQDF